MRSRAYCENIDLLYRLKSFDAALECAQNALGLFPDQEGIALRAARSHIQAGDTDRGIALISRTFKLGMVDADSHRIVIDICRILNKTDPDSALHVMNAAGPNISENLSAFKLLGEAHAKKKAFKEAAANFMIYFRKTKDEKEKKKCGIVLMELESKHKVLEIDDIHEIDNYQATINHPAIGRTFRIAAITNVYNEIDNLSVWIDHYSRQVGSQHCIVLDHGSDDGSSDDLRGAKSIFLPRSGVFNERHRMALITNLANSLLGYYDAVIYSDCDEMLVADPSKFENLSDYAARLNRPVAHAIGLNVRHDISKEAPLTSDRKILDQRTLAHFVSPMCKPLLIKAPVSWGGGFHSCDKPPRFDDLYLFHLRHADRDRALARLNTTRKIVFARDGGGRHHRREEDDLIKNVYEKVKDMKVKEDFDFTKEIELHTAGVELAFSGRYAVFKGTNIRHLNRIPEHMRVF